MKSRFVAVAGLPRAGSTLLCQLLNSHPEIYCEGVSSPLCNSLLSLRRTVSDDQFFLSQLDHHFDRTYDNLHHAMSGLIDGWYHTGSKGKTVVVDKNRAWLHCVELLLTLKPDAKVIVPIRELGQIYGSIESQHQKTILIDFIDHLADYDRFGRANQLFAQDKSIGSPLSSIRAVVDFSQKVKNQLFFLKFEDLMQAPEEVMSKLFVWLGLNDFKINTNELEVGLHESDSHYRFKYLHRHSGKIIAPKPHQIPPRIQAQIQSACAWYYELFYPKK